MYALEDDLSISAFHVQNPLVAEHLGPVHLHDRAQKILQSGRVEGLVGSEHERLHVVVVRMVVRMAAVFAMLVVVVILVIVLLRAQELGVDIELGVQVEAAQVEHLGQRHFAEMDTPLRRAGVHVPDAVGQVFDAGLVNQIHLADEDLVGKADLAARLLARVELGRRVLGIDQCEDRVEQVGFGDLIVHEESLCYRAGVGQPGGFDHHTFEVELALAFLLGEVRKRGAQIFADRAAYTTVVELDDLLAGVLHQDFVVDVLVAELVLDHGDLLSMRLVEHAFEQGGLPGAQETGQDGGGNETHGQGLGCAQWNRV
jgi:hypothetical protein